ncbi:carbohydrate sulfotransferase 11 isoform X2 [Hyalella azteca]|uniref:Carbohydrate sulfotransferase n=1 Tax=Hyalella azteca TaxID=294128 RepID=A0A979FXT0_HYAAZ|nr:carbohydrate sulfotransferase 11 isoform X2 [Hyalella azteca]
MESWRTSDMRFVLTLLVIGSIAWTILIIVLSRNSQYSLAASKEREMQMRDEVADDPFPSERMEAFMRGMTERSESIQTKCSTDALSTQYPPNARHFILDKSQEMLYCALPSTRSVRSLSLLFSKKLRRYRHSLDFQDNIYYTDFQYPERLQIPEYYNVSIRVMVVRNPADRLVVFYQSHLENTADTNYYRALGKIILEKYRDTAKTLSATEIHKFLALVDADPDRERVLGNPFANPVGPTFTEFIKYVVSKPADDEHWTPYHQHCAPCSIDYNFILRFENIEEEGNFFRIFLDSPNSLPIKFTDAIDTPFSLAEVCSYFSQLDKELLSRVVEVYRIDFHLFGYSADEILTCSDEYVRQ